MRIAALAAGAVVAFLSASAVGAATFDFNDIATDYKTAANGVNGKTLNAGQEGTYEQVLAFDPSRFTDDGVSITDITSPDGQDPFFDGADGSGPAGLGVCSSGFNGQLSQCSSAGGSSPGDDNVTGDDPTEEFTIFFDVIVAIDDLLFKNAGHGDLTGTVEINGDSYDVVAGALSDDDLLALGTSDEFTFKWNGSQFYLSSATVSAIPVPAAGLLMVGALGALGALRRKRAAA